MSFCILYNITDIFCTVFCIYIIFIYFDINCIIFSLSFFYIFNTISSEFCVILAYLAINLRQYQKFSDDHHNQLSLKFSNRLSPREFSGKVNSASRMIERFRFLLVKLRAFAGITSKEIIAGGIIGTRNGNIFLVLNRDARDANLVSDLVA